MKFKIIKDYLKICLKVINQLRVLRMRCVKTRHNRSFYENRQRWSHLLSSIGFAHSFHLNFQIFMKLNKSKILESIFNQKMSKLLKVIEAERPINP